MNASCIHAMLSKLENNLTRILECNSISTKGNHTLQSIITKSLSSVKMSKYRPVTHVIFDLDGTLLDTETLYTKIFNKIMGKFNKPGVPDSTRLKMLGVSEGNAVAYLIEDLKLDVTVEKFREILKEEQKELLSESELLPGVERLILHLQKNKIPMACATSSSMTAVELKIEKHKQLLSCLHHIVTGTDNPEIKKSKPAPDIFLLCASKFPDCPDPRNCLVFEDAVSGVTGAKAACMQVIMIPDPKLDKALTKQATLVLESMNDFKPELFCLPPFPSTNCK